MITLKQNSRVRGLFMIERQKHNPDGSPIPGTKEVVAPWQGNLITDSGLDNLAATGFMARCRIGAGSAEPQASDTALASHLATSGTGSFSSIQQGPSGSGFNSVVGTYLFPPGTGTGIIAELGVSPSAGAITTRALVRDENGNPTTITKGPIDSLTVTYQVREYPDLTDTTAQITNPHTSQVYDVVVRGLGVTHGSRIFDWSQHGPYRSVSDWGLHAFSSGLIPADAAPAAGAPRSGVSAAAYSPGSHYVDLTYTWNEGAGNLVGGISSVRTNTPSHIFFVQASFDPPIDKDNTKTLQITMRKSWGRYVP